ncbi:MAG: putative HTH transcriptional regulator [Gammaproteobacteria bacterium]|jgi:predicted HTH transcriptional regulator
MTLKTEKPGWLPWIGFFLNALKRQKDHLASKTTGQGYSGLSHECMQIMQYVDEHSRITMRDAENPITTVSSPMIKNRFSERVVPELLIRNGKARGTWYSRPT